MDLDTPTIISNLTWIGHSPKKSEPTLERDQTKKKAPRAVHHLYHNERLYQIQLKWEFNAHFPLILHLLGHKINNKKKTLITKLGSLHAQQKP
jgi:hypothetical protein